MATKKAAATKAAHRAATEDNAPDIDTMIEDAKENIRHLSVSEPFASAGIKPEQIAVHQRKHTIAAINQVIPDHGMTAKELHNLISDEFGIKA